LRRLHGRWLCGGIADRSRLCDRGRGDGLAGWRRGLRLSGFGRGDACRRRGLRGGGFGRDARRLRGLGWGGVRGGVAHRRGLRLGWLGRRKRRPRSEEHTSELQSRGHLVCRLLLEKKKNDRADRTVLLNLTAKEDKARRRDGALH